MIMGFSNRCPWFFSRGIAFTGVFVIGVLSITRVTASADTISSGPFVGRDADGQLEVFKLDARGALFHRWQKPSNGAWSSWSGLGGSLSPGFAIINTSNGEMEIFGVDRASHNLMYVTQLTTNSLEWSPWKNLGGSFEPSVATGINLDGRIEIFAIDRVTHHAEHRWQTARSTGWSSWTDLGGSLEQNIAVKENKDGRLELFGLGVNGALVHCWQNHPNATNDWSGWASLGDAIQPGFVVAQNVVGRMEVFAVNRSGNIIRICQATPCASTNWTAWENFGPNVKPGLATGQSGDQRLEVFGVSANDSSVVHRWELFDYGEDKWSPWSDMKENSASVPAVGVNEDSNLEVFVSDPADRNIIHYRRQISSASDWLDWSSLDQPVFDYSLRSWQVDEGLPDNIVQAITQTADGFLWVGTRNGLARFDGSQFVCYDAKNTPALKNSSVTALCAGRDGSLWIGTDGGGLIRLNNGNFSRFARTNGLTGDNISAIFESADGSLWIGTTSGISCYQNGRFKNYTERDGLLSGVIRCIYEDRDKNIWIGTGKGLNRLGNTGTFDAYVMPNGLPNNSVRSICQDQGGRIWIGSNNGLLWYDWFWKIDFYAYNTRYGLSDEFVSAITEDTDGNLWVGTYSGLNRFHDGRFYSQPDGDGQPFDRVNALFADREGDLWVGSREGLTRLTPEKFFTYTKEQGLTHNNVMSILEDPQGNFWIGTWGGGLDELSGENVTARTLSSTNTLSQDFILSLCQAHDGSLWVGADFDGGLTHLFNGNVVHYTWRDGLIDAGLRVIHEDNTGTLWIGTDHGLSCLKGGKFFANRLTAGLKDDSIRDIAEDASGSLWFATQNGLARWRDNQLTRFTMADGLSANALSALYVDGDNSLWIGTTGGGLDCYRNGQITSYTTRQGLFCDDISGILEDGGWLWISSSKGIFRIRKKDVDTFDAGKSESIVCLSYGKNDGMESPQCNGGGKPCAWKSADGRLWFPTGKGLVVVDPKTLKLDEEPPSVFIDTVIADQKTIEDGRFELAGATPVLARRLAPLVVPPGRGALEFQYVALNLSAPEKDRFRYHLDGVDSGWIDAGMRRVAYYNNLAPGDYRFQVQACNNDGVWNQTGATLAVTLTPHYFEMLWFRGLLAFAIVGTACAVALYLTRRRMQRQLIVLERQQAVEKERGRIARDMHDQIGAGLTQIGLLGEFARRASKNVDGTTHVDKICATARELAQTLDEMVWMVNPKNDSLNKLGLYLASYVEEFFETTSIRCRIDVPPGLPAWPVPADVRHNLFLTVKEALNNIVKHSRALEARFRLALEDTALEITISDDGAGFPIDTATLRRNGLSNMRERIKEIGGTLNIWSQPEKGTRICLRVAIVSSKGTVLTMNNGRP